ncbi:hypothetical protein IOLA_013 [uncultured bacterium]|nr:hypothetical protein IOLA_013 [uncultured bacterium]
MNMITNKLNIKNIYTPKLNYGIQAKYNENVTNGNRLLCLINITCWILSIISIICIILTFIPIILILNDIQYTNIYSILNNTTINTTSILVGSKQLKENKNLIRNLIFNFSNQLLNINKDSFIKSFGGDILSSFANSYGEFYRAGTYSYFYLIQTIHFYQNSDFFDKQNKLNNVFVDHANKFFLELSEKYVFLNNKCLKFIFSLGENCVNIEYIINQLLVLINIFNKYLSRYQANIWNSELNNFYRELNDYELKETLLLFNNLFSPSDLYDKNINKINNLYNSGYQFNKEILSDIIITMIEKSNSQDNKFLKLIKIQNQDIILNRMLYLVRLLINHKNNISKYKYELRSMEFRRAMCIALSDLNILNNINNEMTLSIKNTQNRMYMYNEIMNTIQFPYQIDQIEYGNIISHIFGMNKIRNINKHKEYVITQILNRSNLNNLNGFMCKNGLEAYLRNNYRIEFECFEKDIGNFCKFSTWYLNNYNNQIMKYMTYSINSIFDHNIKNIKSIIQNYLKDVNDKKSISKIGRDSYLYGDIINFISTIDKNII